MNNQAIIYALIGLVAGALIAGIAATTAVNANNTSMMRMMGMSTESMQDHHGDADSSMTMDDMVGDLNGITGDDFDQAFLEGMIEHHQGAVEMAEQAKKNAKHDELKQMADDITSAQESEIKQMQQWQMDWGYETKSSMPGMSH